MNLFLAIINEGASIWEILLIAVAGSFSVIIALSILTVVVSLLKHLNPKSPAPIVAEKEAEPPKTQQTQDVTDFASLDDNLKAAALAAVSLELKLHHENEPMELTFDYQPRVISAWSMANFSKN